LSNPRRTIVTQAALLSLLFLAPPGVYFEQTTVVYEGGRLLGPGVSTRVWLSGRRMRLEPAGSGEPAALLLLLDESKAFRLEPEERVARALDLVRLQTRSQMDLSMAGDLMGAGEKDSARTRELAGPRTIAGLSCTTYRITAGSTVMDLCVTAALPVGVDAFVDFLDWSGASRSLAGIVDEVRRLPGFPLETRARVTVLGEVHETLSTVTRVEAGPQPQSLFAPPPGYRVVAEEAPPGEEDAP
jgi:hypothetical protein